MMSCFSAWYTRSLSDAPLRRGAGENAPSRRTGEELRVCRFLFFMSLVANRGTRSSSSHDRVSERITLPRYSATWVQRCQTTIYNLHTSHNLLDISNRHVVFSARNCR